MSIYPKKKQKLENGGIFGQLMNMYKSTYGKDLTPEQMSIIEGELSNGNGDIQSLMGAVANLGKTADSPDNKLMGEPLQTSDSGLFKSAFTGGFQDKLSNSLVDNTSFGSSVNSSKFGGFMEKKGDLISNTSKGLKDSAMMQYEEDNAGRYGLNQVSGDDKIGMGISRGANALADKMDSSMYGKAQLEGVADISQGLSTKKEGRQIGDRGVVQKTYDGTGAGKVAGGVTKLGVSTGLEAFGVNPKIANTIGSTLGSGVEAVGTILGDKEAKKKRRAESNRIDNAYTSMIREDDLGESFEAYATKMPHYDKYAQKRYAKNGGSIHKPKKFFKGGAVVLGGQLHKHGNDRLGKGNPIYQDGAKVAETEREELLLNIQQTNDIEKHIKLYDETKDKTHLIHLGKIMQNIIANETEDKSGKYSKKIG